MINLLTDDGKGVVRREYRTRLIAVFLWMCTSVLLLGALALLPSYFLSAAKQEAATEELALIASPSGGSAGTPAAELSLAREMLLALSATLSDIQPSQRITDMLAVRPAGITVLQFEYTALSSEETVRIQGVAANRDALIAFRKKLSEIPLVSSVELPVSNLAKSTKIEYVLTVHISKKHE